MARPTKEDRSQVAESTLTVRLTEGLRATLDQLVELRRTELADEGVEMTAASFIRGLILREAKARGVGATVIMANPTTPSELPTPTTPTAKTVAPTAKTVAPTLRARVEKAIESISAASLARSAGIDPGQLSRFKKSGTGLSPEKEAKLTAALDRM